MNNQSNVEFGVATRGESQPEAEYQQYPRTEADVSAAIKSAKSPIGKETSRLTFGPVVREIGVVAVEGKAEIVPVNIIAATAIENAL